MKIFPFDVATPGEADNYRTDAAVHQVAKEPTLIAPPRIWIDLDDGQWSESPSSLLPSAVEYLAATPIQAALEKCEARNYRGGAEHYITFVRSDWEALVAAVRS